MRSDEFSPVTHALARRLLAAYDHGHMLPAPSASNPTFGWQHSYEVAACIAALRLERGERPVGRKIGFTNRNIWPQYGATAPIWAHVYDSTLIWATHGHAQVSLDGSVAARIEPEIAFGLSGPLSAGCDDPATLLESIAWMAPAFELVDCHYAGWKFKSADAVADQSFHWRLVVGEPVPVGVAEPSTPVAQLRDCVVELLRDGTVQDRGVGSNALGHPVLALAFLAGLLLKQPAAAALDAGEIITTGTLTSALGIRRGETWQSKFTGIGLSPLTLELT